jgi:hypothetical protein
MINENGEIDENSEEFIYGKFRWDRGPSLSFIEDFLFSLDTFENKLDFFDIILDDGDKAISINKLYDMFAKYVFIKNKDKNGYFFGGIVNKKTFRENIKHLFKNNGYIKDKNYIKYTINIEWVQF